MRTSNSVRLVLATGLALGLLPEAFAAGTAAGTLVTNTASVDYVVGGVNQPDVNSNTVTFNVDRKINLTVAESGGAATTVVPGDSGKVTTFTVTNDSNDTLDFSLAVTQDVSTTAAPISGTDNFDVTFPATYIFVESGATPGYQALEDTETYIDELGPDLSKTVYVVANIPAGRSNGDIAGITLTATARLDTNGTTGALVATPGTLAGAAAETNVASTDNATFTDTVFGDGAGDTDAAGDGKHSDDDQYTVSSAAIAVTKSATVVSDPFNCTTEGDNTSCANPPKAIPGAIVEYCLDIYNSGSAAASSIILTDAIPTGTAYFQPGGGSSITSAATGTGTACDIGTGVTEDNDASDGGEADTSTGDYNVTTAGAVTVRTPSIASSGRFKATFRVKINAN